MIFLLSNASTQTSKVRSLSLDLYVILMSIILTGRLGYACLNTVLRTQKPEPIFCSRTCRKDTIHKNGLDFAKNLGLQNCRDLCKLIEVCILTPLYGVG